MNKQTQEKLGSWHTRFGFVFNKLDEYSEIIGEEYEKGTVYPAIENIFKAFELTPYGAGLKCVIIGQDPYPGTYTLEGKKKPYAMGYAFGNPSEVPKLAPSLERIGQAVEASGFNFNDCTLEKWCKQGVLLLNTALTVRANDAGSHKKYWEEFTRTFIQAVSYTPGLIWLLWGSHAHEYEKYISAETSHIIKVEHPIAGSYRGKSWQYDDCFNKVNFLLEYMNGKEAKIKW
jgi:uracil-DNA glycosylase